MKIYLSWANALHMVMRLPGQYIDKNLFMGGCKKMSLLVYTLGNIYFSCYACFMCWFILHICLLIYYIPLIYYLPPAIFKAA